MATPMGLTQLSRILLELYDPAAPADGARFRSWALRRLQSQLPFSGAAWAYGALTARGVVLHDIACIGLAPGFAEAVRATADTDPTSAKMAAAPGRSFIHARTDYPEEMLRLAADPDDLHSSVEGMIVEPETGLFGSVCLFRNRALPAFREPERRLHESLMPHWLQAPSRRLLSDAISGAAALPEGQGFAVARSNLALEAVSGAFVSLLREEWPAWSGGELPAELDLGRETLAPTPFVGRCITATITRSPSHVLVRLRERRAVDALGRREREVADLLAEGLTLKEAASRLALSPSTIESHRDNIYRKLGVSNRSGLLRALRD